MGHHGQGVEGDTAVAGGVGVRWGRLDHEPHEKNAQDAKISNINWGG
jgi:hypothetical protein